MDSLVVKLRCTCAVDNVEDASNVAARSSSFMVIS